MTKKFNSTEIKPTPEDHRQRPEGAAHKVLSSEVIPVLFLSVSSDVSLDPSESVDPLAIERDDDPATSEKFGYTVWTVAKTTTTVTVRYTNTATTVKISYYCGAGGVRYPANSC